MPARPAGRASLRAPSPHTPGQRAEPAQATSESRPCPLHRARQCARALRSSFEPAEDVPEGPLSYLDAHHWAGKRTSGVPPLLGAEAHLPEQ